VLLDQEGEGRAESLNRLYACRGVNRTRLTEPRDPKGKREGRLGWRVATGRWSCITG
jgi:hypothetical protein